MQKNLHSFWLLVVLFLLSAASVKADSSDCLYDVSGISAPKYIHDKAFKRAVWDDSKKRATILTKENGKIVVQYSACAEFGVDVDYRQPTNSSTPDLGHIRQQVIWLSGLAISKDVGELVRSYLDSASGRKDFEKLLTTRKTMLDLSGNDAYTELSIYVDFYPNSHVAIAITAIN